MNDDGGDGGASGDDYADVARECDCLNQRKKSSFDE